MNSKLTGEGADEEVQKNHWHFHLLSVTFGHRRENKSCSACRDRLNERLKVVKVVKVKVFQVFKSGTILQKPTGHSLIYSFIPVWRVWGDWSRQERSSSSIRTPQLLGLVLVLVLVHDIIGSFCESYYVPPRPNCWSRLLLSACYSRSPHQHHLSGTSLKS